jgi:hypothetical protein
MLARIDKNMDPALSMTTHDYGLLAHIAGNKIARMRNLRWVRHIEPASPEHPLLLRLVDLRVSKYARADCSLLKINEIAPIRHSPLLTYFVFLKQFPPLTLRVRRYALDID